MESFKRLDDEDGTAPPSAVGTPSAQVRRNTNIALPSVDQSFGVYRGPRDPSRLDRYDDTEDWMNEDTTGRRIHYQDFSTIDWIHDLTKERLRLKRLRSAPGIEGKLWSMFDASQAWIVVSLVGISAGVTAAFIDIVSEWLGDMKSGYCKTTWYLNKRFCCWEEPTTDDEYGCQYWQNWAGDGSSPGQFMLNYFMYILFAVLFSCLAATLVRLYAPYAAGSGIPEVKTILSGFIIRKFLGWWTLLIKSLGLSFSVASGLTLGKEGPLVHVACCCGNLFPRMFKKYSRNEAKKREILSAASAAGVSVAFGAPIGGVLFSLEEVSYYFPYKTLWRSFFCAMIAAVTLQIMNPFRTNQLVLFQVTFDRPWHAFELPLFVLLGVFGGLYGVLFNRLNLKVNAWRRRHPIRNWPVLEVVAVALITALVGYLNVFSRVSMSELVAELFRECERVDFYGLCDRSKFGSVVWSLVFVGLLKAALTVITFGVKVPAGIFIPSMAVGACFGRILGIFVQWSQESSPLSPIFSSCPKDRACITPGTYAMVGAAAALGGVTRMTVSLTVIMFELTGALTFVVPVMTTVMVAKWVGDYFNKDGIYDCLIKLNGYPFLDDKEDYIETTTASDLMIPANRLRYLLGTGETVDSIESLLYETDVKGFPVINDPKERYLLGYAGRAEIQYAVRQARKRRLVSGQTLCNFIPTAYHRPAANDPQSPQGSAPARVFVDTFGDIGSSESQPVPLEENVMLPSSLKHSPGSNASATPSSLDPRHVLDFKSWIDQTPVTVSPRCPMEIVLELFRKLGLRYVLVTYEGRLEGLLTKKDLLAHLQQVRGEAPEGALSQLGSHVSSSDEQRYQSIGRQPPKPLRITTKPVDIV